jgi:hypothetical protein
MRLLALLLLAAASAPALAQPSIIPAPPDPLGDLAVRRALADPAAAACRRGALADAIVVCGRAVAGGGYRVPWQPEPGARVRLIAGEAPGGPAAMGAGACLRLCQQPLMIDLIGGDRSIVNAIGRGIGRLLHPD